MPMGDSEPLHFENKPEDIAQPVSHIFVINAVHVLGPESGPFFLEQHGSNHSGWNWGACIFWVRISASISGPTLRLELSRVFAIEKYDNALRLCD